MNDHKATDVFTREQIADGVDASTERLLCTGLIVSDRVVREIRPIWHEGLFASDFTNWVARTCFAFFDLHGVAPRNHVRDLFEAERKAGRMDKRLLTLVGDFLQSISAEYEKERSFNEDYVMLAAGKYFSARHIITQSREAIALVEAGRLEDARTLLEKPAPDLAGEELGMDPFGDAALIERAFAHADKPLFTLPGAAGGFLNRQLVRGGLIGILARVKDGKTFLLMELAKRAARARNNVAFFGIGDMIAEEYTLRWMENLAGRSADPEYCAAGWVPCLDCAKNQRNECTLAFRRSKVGLDRLSGTPHPEDAPKEYRTCDECRREKTFEGAAWWRWRRDVPPLEAPEGIRMGRRFLRRLRGRRFRLVERAGRQLSPSGIQTMLRRWRDRENWIPDVIVIDYFDVMGSDDKSEALRHREDAKWCDIRAIAQEWRCLVIGATQSDADSYKATRLGLSNFNEARTKYDHATAFMAVSRTDAERERGLARWNMLVQRKGRIPGDVVTVMSLSQGRPLIGSWWRHNEARIQREV